MSNDLASEGSGCFISPAGIKYTSGKGFGGVLFDISVSDGCEMPSNAVFWRKEIALSKEERKQKELVSPGIHFILKGGLIKQDEKGIFTQADCDRTTGSCFKLKDNRFRLDFRKKSFPLRVVRP